jgi:hypothetical protein
MKVLFVLFRRGDVSHEQCLAEWGGQQHISAARRVPGLTKWIQNHVARCPRIRPLMGSASSGSIVPMR